MDKAKKTLGTNVLTDKWFNFFCLPEEYMFSTLALWWVP